MTQKETSCRICNKEYNMYHSHPIAPDICGPCWDEIDPDYDRITKVRTLDFVEVKLLTKGKQ